MNQMNIIEYQKMKMHEQNEKRFIELNITCCRSELYAFMLAINEYACNKFITLSECHNCQDYDKCKYMNEYTLGEFNALANPQKY